MEKREHPRIQIPLVVELNHPSLGVVEVTGRDISAGGVFVDLPNPQLRVGAKLKVRIKKVQTVDIQSTPMVDMQVARTADDGLGLAFVNRSAEHLWRSVERLRQELQIGSDYFQVYLSVVLCHAQRGVLVAQRHGKWVFPGEYMSVGDIAEHLLEQFVTQQLGLAEIQDLRTIEVDSGIGIPIPEAATVCVVYRAETDDMRIRPAKGSMFSEVRWLNTLRDVEDITFASEGDRTIASRILREHLQAHGPGVLNH